MRRTGLYGRQRQKCIHVRGDKQEVNNYIAHTRANLFWWHVDVTYRDCDAELRIGAGTICLAPFRSSSILRNRSYLLPILPRPFVRRLPLELSAICTSDS